jgi:hypothetical protein
MSGKGKRRNPERERFWRETVARQTRSGLSVREFCEREGLALSTYHYWRRELVRRDSETTDVSPEKVDSPRPAFVPVSLEGRSAAAIEIELVDGTLVRVPRGCDAGALRTVLAALESA